MRTVELFNRVCGKTLYLSLLYPRMLKDVIGMGYQSDEELRVKTSCLTRFHWIHNE
jgi:hypothetical protein